MSEPKRVTPFDPETLPEDVTLHPITGGRVFTPDTLPSKDEFEAMAREVNEELVPLSLVEEVCDEVFREEDDRE